MSARRAFIGGKNNSTPPSQKPRAPQHMRGYVIMFPCLLCSAASALLTSSSGPRAPRVRMEAPVLNAARDPCSQDTSASDGGGSDRRRKPQAWSAYQLRKRLADGEECSPMVIKVRARARQQNIERTGVSVRQSRCSPLGLPCPLCNTVSDIPNVLHLLL